MLTSSILLSVVAHISGKNQDSRPAPALATRCSLRDNKVVGYYLGARVEHTLVVGIEGVAAGAMLTMTAQTMIPEAVHPGSPNIVGLSTLAGFLSAVAFKIFES